MGLDDVDVVDGASRIGLEIDERERVHYLDC
jgi:hypothetical protein